MIDAQTYNYTLIVSPQGFSLNVTCIATYGSVNYSQFVILHSMLYYVSGCIISVESHINCSQ